MPPGLKARTGSAADALIQAFWAAGFAGLSRVRPTRPRPWASPGGERVLVVAPHPDDEVAGCAGTLLRHRLAGDTVTVVVATDGRRSRALGLSPSEMAAKRRQEAGVAADRLGVALRWIGLPEGEWSDEELSEDLRRVLQERATAIVYAPSLVDFHPEHTGVARSLSRALDDGSRIEVRVYAIQVPLTARLANLISPVRSVLPALAEAMEAHASQVASLRRCLRMRAYAGARHGVGEPAEEFWSMTAAEYRRLNADGTPTFRGLRHHAATDPLAYLVGRRARARLRALSAGTGP